MNVRGFIIFTLFVCTCAPPPATDESTSEKAIRQQEDVVAGAYQSLDAAVLDRLLAPDFELVYPATGNRKDRTAYLSDLAALRQQFPPLTVTLDSLHIEIKDDGAIAEGIRSFSWQTEGTEGQYAEHYRNQWTYQNENWKLTETTLLSTTAR
jgi:hypothetical protein